MSGLVKNMYSDVAKSQNFAIFVVRTDTKWYQQSTYFLTLNSVVPLSTFGYAVGVGSQNLTGATLLFLPIHINLKLLTDKCEPKLKAVRRHEVSYLHNTSLEYLSAPSGVGLTTTNQALIYRTTTKPHPKRRPSVWLANTSSRFFRYTPLWRVKSSVSS